jgi:poly(A) polymerase
LHEFGLVEPVLPELVGDRWDRAVRVVECLPREASFCLAFAALLHEVGKPAVEQIADQLRLSTAEKTRVAWLVEKHTYLADAPTMRLSKLKTILVHPGIGELLALHRADALASGKSLEHVEFCERMLRDTPPEELNPPPVLTGEDLIALGMKPGPEFKRLLDAVREAQLEGRVRTKEDSLKLVEELLRGWGKEPPPAPEIPPG